MPIQLKEESGGQVLVVHVSGKLHDDDYKTFVPQMESVIEREGKWGVAGPYPPPWIC